MIIGKHSFDFEKEFSVMGILNVTPDSFSDGGRFNDMDRALAQTERMISEGATIIDVGGESTRPGHTQISDDEEIERVVPIIAAIKKNFDVAISLDTYKSQVAKAGIEAGADLINDIWGLKYDPNMAGVIAAAGVACCLMHNKNEAVYNNYVSDVISELKECLQLAEAAGIAGDRIMLDPGVGFGKTYEQNLQIINECDRLVAMGYPVLLGTSRKSVIGLTLNNKPQERAAGTVATTVMGYERGCRIFRVHDVKENYDALMMAQAISGLK